MKREFLKSIEGLTDEAIDKIMAEAGKDAEAAKAKLAAAETDLEKSKSDATKYQEKVKELEKSIGDNADLKKKFDDLQAQVDADKKAAEAAKADEVLTGNIVAAFGDKKFVNDYTKNALVADIKVALADPKNAGKGIEKIFTELTADKEGIFDNPNKPGKMAGMSNVDMSKVTKEEFAKMGYLKRNELYRENPEMYRKLNSEE